MFGPHFQFSPMPHPFLAQDFHIRWSTLTPDAVEADISQALEQAEAALDAYVTQDRGRLNFATVILALDEATRPLTGAWSLVNHLDSLCNSPALREAQNKMLPVVTAFFAKIPLNPHIWDLLLTYSNTDEARNLTEVKRRALVETMDSFRQHGADLPQDKKARLEQIEAELSRLTQKFSENVLDSTNAWELVLADASRLKGLPESSLEAARQDAAAKGLGTPEAPQYRFTLKAPSLIPVLEFLEDEDLRRQVWLASSRVGSSGAHDNTPLVWQILALRHEKALLLGQAHFADQILQQRMARTGSAALKFVNDLHRSIRPAFERETIALQEFRADVEGRAPDLFEPWQVAFWAEKQRRAEYDFDPEELRPWFPLDQTLAGMFGIAARVFDLRTTPRETVDVEPGQPAPPSVSGHPGQPGPVEVWHPSVRFYEVRNEKGTHIGSFYADWHPRDSKRGGVL